MKDSRIGWTTHTWNAVTGCDQVSEGCDNCYAKAIAERAAGSPAFPDGFGITLRPHKLREPAKWQASRVFVNSMSDAFHRDIPDEYLQAMWSTMLFASQHQYQVLTKRPHRAAAKIRELGLTMAPHIWIGVSVENQRWAENRIPALLEIPAPVRWLSCEPLLGPLDLTPWLGDLQWVVDGGESGPGRREADYDWFREIRDQCEGAGVAYFHKQGNHFREGQDRVLDGRTWEAYPC